jgi:inorganic pyrophosphatase
LQKEFLAATISSPMPFSSITAGDKCPQIVNVVIEIPKGSHNKYEYDEELDEIRLDRVLYSAVFYPTDYGFIPQTRSEDGDHLDILVVISEPLFPGCILPARPIGILSMEDEAGKDDKIIAVALKDPRLKDVNDIKDLDDHYKKEIQNFFEMYKKLERKPVKIHRWHAKDYALQKINEARERFCLEKEVKGS